MANMPFPPITAPDQMAMSALDLAQFTQSINQFVGGPLAALGPNFVSSGASANTFLTANVNGGFLAIGNVIRAKVTGTPSTTSAVTITLNFGAASVTFISNATANPFWCELEVTITGTATEDLVSFGVGNITPVVPTHTTGTVNTAAAVAISLTSTVAAGTATIYSATIELIR